MKRIKKILLMIAVCVLIAVCAGCSDSKSESEDGIQVIEETKVRTAIIFKLMEGNGTTVTRNGACEEAYEGMRIFGGDVIATDAESSTYLRVDDDKNILLDKDSKLIVSELSNGKLLIEIKEGSFFFEVKNKLAADEEMSFTAGATSMSVRGTSGAGSLKDSDGAFSIYTGLGTLTNTSDPTKEYPVLPNTIAHFDAKDPEKTFDLAIISEDEISPLLKEYIKDNSDLIEKLEDKGWDISEEGIIPSDTIVPDNIEDGSSLFAGWELSEDGTWEFSKEAFENNEGPTNFEVKEEPKKEEPVVLVEPKEEVVEEVVKVVSIDKPTVSDDGTITYDGEEHLITVTGFDETSMKITGTKGGKDVGSYTVTITPNNGYAWKGGGRTPVTATLVIEPIELNIQDYTTIYKTYDGINTDEREYEGDECSKFVGGENVGISLKVTGVSKCVGTYNDSTIEFTLYGEDKGNYKIADTSIETCTFVIEQKEVTVDITLSKTSMIYNGRAFPQSNITASCEGLINGDDVELSVSASSEVDAGTYSTSTTLTGDDAGNYSLPSDCDKEYTINKKTLNFTLGTGISKVYDGQAIAASSLTFTFTGKVGTDSITYTADPGSYINAGTYTPTVTLTGDTTNNYKLGTVSGTYAITKKDLDFRLAAGTTKVYDGNPISSNNLIFTVTGKVGNDSITYNANPGYNINVGSYTPSITLTGTTVNNYKLGTVSGTYSITKRTASIYAKIDIVRDTYGVDIIKINPGCQTSNFVEADLKDISFKIVNGRKVELTEIPLVENLYYVYPVFTSNNYDVTTVFYGFNLVKQQGRWYIS